MPGKLCFLPAANTVLKEDSFSRTDGFRPCVPECMARLGEECQLLIGIERIGLSLVPPRRPPPAPEPPKVPR